MQHTPWWESFVSELMGKKAEGEGVRNALKFFSSFHSNRLDKELGDGFIVDRTALFSLVSEDVRISYENAQGKTKFFELESGGTYEAVNKKFSFDEKDYNYKVLIQFLFLKLLLLFFHFDIYLKTLLYTILFLLV